MPDYKQILRFLPDKHKVGRLVGLYRSAFRGKGLEYEDLRQYAPGDDPRNFSWARFAQCRQLLTKTYREERDLQVYIIVDPSLLFVEWWNFKLNTISETISLLTFSSTYNRDKLGAVYINMRGVAELQLAANGKSPITHAASIVKKLTSNLTYKYGEFLNSNRKLSTVIDVIARVVKQSEAIIFILSDFLLVDEQDFTSLQKLKKKADVIAIRILDRWDTDPLPIAGNTVCNNIRECVFNPLLQPFDATQAEGLKMSLLTQISHFQKRMSAYGIDTVEIREFGEGYQQIPFVALNKFFEQRVARRAK